MRIFFNNSNRPLAAAKLLTRYVNHVKLSAAQEAIAKATGYRDWHDLNNSISPIETARACDLDIAKTVILAVADTLQSSHGDVQYALTKSRLFSLTLEENLRLLAMIWRERIFGPPVRGKTGTLVRVPALRAKEVGYLKPGENGYSRILYDSGFGGCASFEVVTPRAAPQDFAPSILWLPYGYWKVDDGSTIAFSRDYKPLWRIKDGITEPANPWDWISDIREEFWFQEIAGVSTWSYGPARDLALKFLAENRIFEGPRLLDAMPFLFNPGETTVPGAVKLLRDSKLNEGSMSLTTFANG